MGQAKEEFDIEDQYTPKQALLKMQTQHAHYFEQWKRDPQNQANVDSLREMIWTYARHLEHYGQGSPLDYLDQMVAEVGNQKKLLATINYSKAEVLSRPVASHAALAHARDLIRDALQTIPDWQERAYVLIANIYAHAVVINHSSSQSFKVSDLTASDRVVYNLVIDYLERAIAVQKSGAYPTRLSTIKHYKQHIEQYAKFLPTKSDLETLGLKPEQSFLIDMPPYDWIQESTFLRPTPLK